MVRSLTEERDLGLQGACVISGVFGRRVGRTKFRCQSMLPGKKEPGDDGFGPRASRASSWKLNKKEQSEVQLGRYTAIAEAKAQGEPEEEANEARKPAA